MPEAVARWPRDRRLMLLHSGRADRQWSRWSVLATSTQAWRFQDGRAGWTHAPDSFVATEDPFAALEALLGEDDALYLGYASYDLGRWVERIESIATDDRAWPTCQWERCPGWLVHDGQTGRWSAHGDWAAGLPEDLSCLPKREAVTAMLRAAGPIQQQTPNEYAASVQRVLDYIAAGDVFQVNLSQRLSVEASGDPRGLFAAWADQSPAWYGAMMELTGRAEDARRTLVSASPELFLQRSGKEVVTRPIKGTLPSDRTTRELEQSAKDAAELHMIVDLMRNDLGRACRVGSVQVQEGRTVETHPTVHHGVATVRGELRPELGWGALLRATLPGGSISGAPKVRAMQIIEALEPARRGPYCGVMGWLQREAGTLNIAIRTAACTGLADDRWCVDYGTGGGVVADSDPGAEHRETLDKAAIWLRALAQSREE